MRAMRPSAIVFMALQSADTATGECSDCQGLHTALGLGFVRTPCTPISTMSEGSMPPKTATILDKAMDGMASMQYLYTGHAQPHEFQSHQPHARGWASAHTVSSSSPQPAGAQLR